MKFHPHSVDSTALNRHKRIKPGRHLPNPILCEPSIQAGYRLAFIVPSDNGHVIASGARQSPVPTEIASALSCLAMTGRNVTLSPSPLVTLTLNGVKGKNLVPLRAGSTKNSSHSSGRRLEILRRQIHLVSSE